MRDARENASFVLYAQKQTPNWIPAVKNSPTVYSLHTWIQIWPIRGLHLAPRQEAIFKPLIASNLYIVCIGELMVIAKYSQEHVSGEDQKHIALHSLFGPLFPPCRVDVLVWPLFPPCLCWRTHVAADITGSIHSEGRTQTCKKCWHVTMETLTYCETFLDAARNR